MVVGAGIGGLTASLVLSRVAARVTLVERAERPSEVGAALALQPNGMAVLDRLGLLPAVEAVSARIDRVDIRSVTGRRLLTAGMPDLGGGLDHAIAVRRTDLQQLLLEAVAGVALIDTRFGCAVLSADPSGAVRIASTAENSLDLGSMSPAGRRHRGCRRSQFGRAQYGWLQEPDVAREQLCTHDCEGSGQPVVRGVLDPIGILRPGTAGWRPDLKNPGPQPAVTALGGNAGHKRTRLRAVGRSGAGAGSDSSTPIAPLIQRRCRRSASVPRGVIG